jgi:hypothetical protein
MRKISYSTLSAFIVISSIQLGCGFLNKKTKSVLGDPTTNFSLTGDEAKNFEAWKKSPVKSCLSENAFEGQAATSDQRGIDLKFLFEKSDNSLVLRNGESFVLFGAPYGLLGESTSGLNRSTQIGSNSDSFAAKMTRKGSHCVVEISGEKVYETYLFASVPVLIHGQGAVPEPTPTEHYLTQNSQGLIRHGLLDAFFKSNVRNVELLTQLREFFPDWSKEDLNYFFVNKSFPGDILRHVAHLVGNDEIPPFSAGYPEIPSSVAGWEFYAAPTGDVTYKLSMPVSRVTYGDITNSNDQGLWQLEVNVQWSSSEADRRSFTLNNLSWQQQVPEDSKRVTDCFHTRLKAFSGLNLYGNGAFSPSYDGVTAPCAGLTSDLTAALFADDTLKQHVSNLFAGVSKLETGIAYNWWDVALKDYALHALDIGVDFAKAFDPGKKSPLISKLSLYVSMVGSEAEKHDLLKTSKADYAASLALPWATAGLEVEQAFVSDLMSAIAHIAETFSESLSSWLHDLAKDPKSQAEQISFASAVSSETKAAVKNYLARADAAKVLFVVNDAKLKRVIQDRIDVGTKLPTWNATLDALSTFRSRDFAKADEFGQMSYDRNFDDLSKEAVLGDWSETDFTQIDKLAQLAKKKSFCDSKTDTVSLINCIGKDAFKRSEGGFLAPTYEGRYAELVSDFEAHHGKLEDYKFVFVRQKLVDSFFNPVWKSCDNATFANNKSALAGLVEQLLKADFRNEYEIKNKIDDLLDACN